MNEYIHQDEHGVLRVGDSGPALEGIVYDFERGEAPDRIVQNWPALTLEQVYGAIAYFLEHREQVKAYMARRRREFAEARAEQDRNPAPVIRRLKAMQSGGEAEAS